MAWTLLGGGSLRSVIVELAAVASPSVTPFGRDTMHRYDAAIPCLALNNLVSSLDFLGWGDSGKPATHLNDAASQRADLAALVKPFEPRSVVLVVHHLSGPVGIDWALDNEPPTAGLVLLNTCYQAMPTLKAPEAAQGGVSQAVGVFFGADDPHLNAGVAKEFHGLFAGSRLHRLAGAGHCV